MTRTTLFRVLVAMRLLPNFTAYWWMLPRRMKIYRTAEQYERAVRFARIFETQFDHTRRIMSAINGNYFGTISARSFRIPITRFR